MFTSIDKLFLIVLGNDVYFLIILKKKQQTTFFTVLNEVFKFRFRKRIYYKNKVRFTYVNVASHVYTEKRIEMTNRMVLNT